MTDEQTSFLARPPRDHDTHEAEELMQEGEVEARLGLCRWDRAVTNPQHARRVEEEPTVRLERQGLGCVNDDLGRAVLVGDVDRSGSILVEKRRVRPDELAALFPLLPPLLPPALCTGSSEDDGRSEREGRKYPGDAGGVP